MDEETQDIRELEDKILGILGQMGALPNGPLFHCIEGAMREMDDFKENNVGGASPSTMLNNLLGLHLHTDSYEDNEENDLIANLIQFYSKQLYKDLEYYKGKGINDRERVLRAVGNLVVHVLIIGDHIGKNYNREEVSNGNN